LADLRFAGRYFGRYRQIIALKHGRFIRGDDAAGGITVCVLQ
jgi:hypothetical protein